MIMRDEYISIWKKDSTELRQYEDNKLLLINERLPFGVPLTEEDFFEMIKDGAEHFGKTIKVEEAPILCPNCGHETRIIHHSSLPNQRRRYCTICGLSGSFRSTEEMANYEFKRLTFLPADETISIEEAAERR